MQEVHYLRILQHRNKVLILISAFKTAVRPHNSHVCHLGRVCTHGLWTTSHLRHLLLLQMHTDFWSIL